MSLNPDCKKRKEDEHTNTKYTAGTFDHHNTRDPIETIGDTIVVECLTGQSTDDDELFVEKFTIINYKVVFN